MLSFTQIGAEGEFKKFNNAIFHICFLERIHVVMSREPQEFALQV